MSIHYPRLQKSLVQSQSHQACWFVVAERLCGSRNTQDESLDSPHRRHRYHCTRMTMHTHTTHTSTAHVHMRLPHALVQRSHPLSPLRRASCRWLPAFGLPAAGCCCGCGGSCCGCCKALPVSRHPPRSTKRLAASPHSPNRASAS